MKNKKCGYFYRCRKTLLKYVNPLYGDSRNHYISVSSFQYISKKRRNWIIAHWFDFRGFFFIFIFACSAFAFQGAGDCEKLLTDFAQLTNKSVFLPRMLSGSCVVQSEKHFPLILKSAGFDYRLKDDVIQVSAIEKEHKLNTKLVWRPKSKEYDITFVFVNAQNAYDCGLKISDILAKTYNLEYEFTIGLALGCPVLDTDGSFAFHVNARLLDRWSYSHGSESARQKSTITSSTGAVTTDYEYITTGLNLELEQNETGVFYTLKYTATNGSVTTSHGAIVDDVRATIMDETDNVRKVFFLPIGKEKKLATYSLVLKIAPRNGQ